MVQAFMIPELSGSKCRYIQSFLQGLKSNALRLNEISSTELLYMAAFTATRSAYLKLALMLDSQTVQPRNTI